MARTAKITLGDQEFTVGMLSIGVLRELDAEMAESPPISSDSRATETFHFDRAVKCISVALAATDPKWTVEAVLALPVVGLDEIFEAHRVILFHSGLIKMKDTRSGESLAAA